MALVEFTACSDFVPARKISTRRARHPAILALSGVFLFTIRSKRRCLGSGMPGSIGRRQLLAGTGAGVLLGGLQGCAASFSDRQTRKVPQLQLVPLRAGTDRITRITVCTRPFRAQGPRLDTEQIGAKLVVHNYGHGGSGWSLSWGSSGVAVRKAMASGERDIAVIGCGAWV
jgi:D-amino-acid oxidase